MLIQNAALADVIAGTLHKKPEELKKEDLLELIQLDASDLDIDTLEGLEYAENLEKINVSNNALTNIRPLKNLMNLVNVNLSGNRLRDIEPLDSHYNLEILNLSRNNLYVMDLSAVASMVNLKVLNLKKAKIDSLNYVQNCTQLENICVNTENGPFNYSILGRLPNLKILDMSGM